MFQPRKIFESTFLDEKAQITVGVPLFNRAGDVSEFLKALTKAMHLPFNLILCDDGSTDGTHVQALSVLSSIEDSSKLVRVEVYRSTIQEFETFLDDFMIKHSETRYFIEVQADMIMYEHAFDSKLLKCAQSHSDLIAVSGRGCHTFDEVQASFLNSLNTPIAQSPGLLNYFYHMCRRIMKNQAMSFLERNRVFDSDHEIGLKNPELFIELEPNTFLATGRAGRIDHLADFRFSSGTLRNNKVYVGETVMRGPLLIDIDKYNRVGGFEQETFFLGYDEHDLFLRAYREFRYRVGFIPIGYESLASNGSTRKPRSVLTEFSILLKILTRYRRLGTLGQIDSCVSISPEIRTF